MIHIKLFRLVLCCLALLAGGLPNASAGSISKSDRILQRAWRLHQSILVVHNIDLAPRIKKLRKNAKVKVRGEYIWNSQGGLVHFTHDARYGDHPGGWVKFRGKKYR